MNVTEAVKELFENGLKKDIEIHSLTVYRRGEKIISVSPHPYTPFQKNHVYSVSKSFTSTAIGIACELGYLSLDERIIDFFPEKCPEILSENLSLMTLRHVLSMNTGHEDCVMPQMVNSEDPVKTFLSLEVKYIPGTHFTYNTGASFIASACLTKRTGLTLLDFLEKHLFQHMDIECTKWYSHAGISEGGVGLHISCDDLAKLGLLYLNGGNYMGKRLLSKAYIKEATSAVSDNSGNGTCDWSSGYGYQFWKNSREGYRGDGAYGQLLTVFPKRDIVISMIAECGAMQPQVDLVYDFTEQIENACGKADYSELGRYFDGFYPAGELCDGSCSLFGKTFKLSQNKCGFTNVRFEKTSSGADIFISDGTNISKIALRSGLWEKGELYGRYVKPVLEHLTVSYNEPFSFCSSGDILENKIVATLRGINCPHRVTYEFELCGTVLKITRNGNKNDQHNYTFSGCETE
jgi:hypothetical protein